MSDVCWIFNILKMMGGYGALPYPAIIDIVDNVIFEDWKRRYSNSLVTRILVILQIYGISYASREIPEESQGHNGGNRNS